MDLLIVSFIAGLLTVIAPCALAILPVILGGSLGENNPWRPVIITVSLGISVLVFSLLLKATTALLGVPTEVWQTISGGLILVFGLITIFPSIWNTIAFKLKLYKSEEAIANNQDKSVKGLIFLGAALGPVFSSCSPTYAVILAVVLPQSFATGFLNLTVYSIGLMIPLLLIGYGGQKVAQKFRFAANPNGWFKKILGIMLIVIGLLVLTGYDKVLEAKILDSGYLGPIGIEQSLLDKVNQ